MFLVGGVGGWAATTELAGAVIAPGTIVVESNVKKVQHPTGGVVGEILVKEGDEVEAGQVVLRLDDTVTRVHARRRALPARRVRLAREARLLAERDDADTIAFPTELTGTAQRSVGGRWRSPASRSCSSRDANGADRPALAVARARRANQRGDPRPVGAAGSQGARDRADRPGARRRDRPLQEKSRLHLARLCSCSATRRGLQGERGQLIADIARARGKISETELQIIQIDQDFRTEVLKDLREAQGKIAELKERVTAAEDQLKRVDLRAPQTGFVHQLSVHTVGGVISNGEAIMQIVPRADELVVDAKVAPSDIDQVATGATAIVRIMAGNQRITPEITGVLTRVSADLAREQPQQYSVQPPQAYYTVRIALPPAEVGRLKDIRLLPGMPVETFIQTHERTPLQYLLKPLREQIARTFRER